MRNLNLPGFLLLLEEEEVSGSALVEREGVAEGEAPPRCEREVETPLPLPLAVSAALLSSLAAEIDILLASLRSLC
jgi:hypothetical protein